MTLAAWGGSFAQTGRTVIVQYDKNGLASPSAHADQLVGSLRAGDKLSVQFFPTLIFNLDGLDLPQGISKQSSPFFVYPEDAGVLFPATPKHLMTSLHPGLTNMYVFGGGNYALRATRLDSSALTKLVKTDGSAAWQAFVASAGSKCYAMNDKAIVGQSQLAAKELNAQLLSRAGLPASTTFPRLYAIPGVVIARNDQSPYLELELLDFHAAYQTNSDSAKLAADLGCDGESITAMKAVTPPVIVAQVQTATIVRVAPEFEKAQWQTGDGVRVSQSDFAVLDAQYGALANQTGALSAGPLQYQICYAPDDSAKSKVLAPTVKQRCIPDKPVTLTVQDALPASVRLQPGLMIVNRFREVDLTANVVFLVNREKYFRTVPMGFWNGLVGGYFNPLVGLQVNGSTSQLVFLMGGQLRLIEEAGLTFGLRFGAQGATEPYRLSQNYFVGFSLDPGLFNSLRSSAQPAPPAQPVTPAQSAPPAAAAVPPKP
jgi:hypothetical protein